MKKHEILTRESCKLEHKLFKNSRGGSGWGHIFWLKDHTQRTKRNDHIATRV